MLRRSRSRRALRAALAVSLIVALGVFVVRYLRDEDAAPQSVDPVARACELDQDILVRLWRGHDPVASEDVTMVPREPNFIGTFDLVSHSGPWDYLQRIPLVLYGRGHINASEKPVHKPANIVDVYPTIGALLGVDLPQRDGRVLDEALAESFRPPRLVVVVVWDGAGRATLEQWPDRWPTLARLEREGTSYLEATVGTSPSVTSAVHSSLGTGAWPRAHKVTGNDLRKGNGELVEAFAGESTEALSLTTFADEIDRAYDNESRVGLLAWTPWHVGMLGHGRATRGGDADEMALLEYRDGVRIDGNDKEFSVPDYLPGRTSIGEHVDSLDRSDGTVDESWLGHDISLESETTWLTYWNPAWASFQEDLLEEMIDRRGYGRDDIPDILFVNFKMTDLAGHRWALDSEETGAALGAQDSALGRLIQHLDAVVGSYVVVVTADHGHSRKPTSTGAWPIVQDRLIEDLDTYFEVSENADLVEGSSAFGLYLDARVMTEAGITAQDVAKFLNSYTIRDNWGDGDLPEGYGSRGGERVFSAAFGKEQMNAVMRCAFGSSAPPRNARA